MVIDVSFHAKELRPHVKRIEDGERLATEKTHHVMSRKGFQKEKLRRAGEGFDSSAFRYKKFILYALREQMFLTNCDPFLTSRDAAVQMAQPISTKYSKKIEPSVREWAVRSKKENVFWNVHDS